MENKKRKRINTVALCSSYNYELSRKVSTTCSSERNKRPYAKVWGKLIPISKEEISDSICVVWQ